MRQCSKCGVTKSGAEFWRNPTSPDNLYSYCKACGSESDKKRWRNKDISRRNRYLKRTYNISFAQAEHLLMEQDSKCANPACRKPLTFQAASRHNAPYIDHDHTCCPGNTSCGECVRGVLCLQCNVGLAMFHDSIVLLEGAKKYLSLAVQPERLNPEGSPVDHAIVRSALNPKMQRLAEMFSPVP